jgi:hypothetical protein
LGALYYNTTASNNTAMGVSALNKNTTASYNTAVGMEALYTTTTGGDNDAFGYRALYDNTTGASNVAFGGEALGDNTTASYNVAVGTVALRLNTTGSHNTAVGRAALYTNTTGYYNVATGYQALNNNTTGYDNTAIGFQALKNTSTGFRNVAVGLTALYQSTTGTYNTAIGHEAGLDVTTGSNNTFLGRKAGYYTGNGTLTTGTTSTFVGSYSYPHSSGCTNTVVIGHAVGGADGYTTIGHGSSDIRAAHGSTTWSTVSDERYKKDIVDSTAGLGFVNALQPRTFKYKTLGELPETFSAYKSDSTEDFKNSNTNLGFIAQEVKAAIDADASIKDGFRMWDDRPDGSQEVAETALIPVLVKAIQELSAKVEALEAQLNT